MSAKINMMNIVYGHYNTLSDTKNKISLSDVFSFFIVPLACSLIALTLKFKSTNDTISLAVNFGAIFTALLMSVLVLVYDQQNKINDKIKHYKDNRIKVDDVEPTLKYKLNVMRELYFNISYCIISSIVLVIASSINSIFISIKETSEKCPDFIIDINYIILTPIIIFIASHLLITILMVVKRLHNLLIAE